MIWLKTKLTPQPNGNEGVLYISYEDNQHTSSASIKS